MDLATEAARSFVRIHVCFLVPGYWPVYLHQKIKTYKDDPDGPTSIWEVYLFRMNDSVGNPHFIYLSDEEAEKALRISGSSI